jgi:DNA-binding transcriptional regulator GbsR (MarR family)
MRSKPTISPSWLAARRKFVEAGGHTTQSFGLGRIMGQIYALLYLSPTPMCLDDIANELGVSKASVSTTVRQLGRWAAVKRVWVRGDRKDYYEAETDFPTVLRHGLLTTMRKKLETAGTQITHVEDTLRHAHSKGNGSKNKDMQVVVERLERAKQFQSKIHELLANPLLDHLL